MRPTRTTFEFHLHEERGFFSRKMGEEHNVDVDTLIIGLKNQYQAYKEFKENSLESLYIPAPPKSLKNAKALRNRGNQLFKKRLNYEALDLYTESVAFSPDDSKELALAYADRSAVLFQIQEYSLCLHDINRALEGKYPDNLRKKLRKRKKQCFIESRCPSENQKQSVLIEDDETDPHKTNSSDDVEWREFCNFSNPLIPNASSKIKLEYDENWGRHIVTTEDINPGEILYSQKFFVSMLQPENKYKNCSHCLSKCYILIPCTSCTQVMYCCKDCQEQAYNSYHRIECKVLAFQEYTIELKEVFIALRMLLIGTEQGAQLENLMTKLTMHDIFTEGRDSENEFVGNDYLATLKLCRTMKHSFVEHSMLTVTLMMLLLQRVGFFKNEIQQDSLAKPELFAALLLLNHLVSVEWYNVNVFLMKSADLSSLQCHTEVASGICLLSNLLNHSCNPHAMFLVRKQEHVLFTLRPIKKGEQIFISYCSPYFAKTKEERISEIAHHSFECICEACIHNWPLISVLVWRKVEFIIDHKEEAIRDLLSNMDPIIQNGLAGRNNYEVHSIIVNLCNWLHANTKPPNICIIQCEFILKMFTLVWFDDIGRQYMGAVCDDKFIEKTLTCIIQRIY